MSNRSTIVSALAWVFTVGPETIAYVGDIRIGKGRVSSFSLQGMVGSWAFGAEQARWQFHAPHLPLSIGFNKLRPPIRRETVASFHLVDE
ncbi:hypothetical protein TWF718_002679 [Orbilia javanica]|uniref:Uncharacterized protein n=1 Tax=Orbilia javanica TaxID=47235 RepID=A0AAN8RCR3_9PEZI